MKKKLLKVLSYIAVLFLGYILNIVITNVRSENLKNSVIYEVVVEVEKINLRKSVDLDNVPIKEVYKGEKLQVVEYYEGNKYNWYKVIYDENKTGWIASGKEINWVSIVR